ncbi:helix-hairpin-helix domain-containing protein [Gordonia sp. VNQ95]|jgi:hypothetical protein|uniref:helix-hairpin-helix domain-containing protein n=1 Tax=Gordonia sp. VNQ95 TaxID=3156619 RepID=UPI0032B48411
MGKSYLLRIAEHEQRTDWSNALKSERSDRPFPVYVSFADAAVDCNDGGDTAIFRKWMIRRIGHAIYRAFRKAGLIEGTSGEPDWTSIEQIKELTEDHCENQELSRVAVYIDEAAHVFNPVRQSSFFSLMRALRSSTITINAAVYPGVTNYGPEFELGHDAHVIDLVKDIASDEYLDWCREIRDKQLSDSIRKKHSADANLDNFHALCFSASGNPRLLVQLLVSSSTNPIKDGYNQLLSLHSSLGDKFPGRRDLIDWGRIFFEDKIVKEMVRQNRLAIDLAAQPHSSAHSRSKPQRFFVWADRRRSPSVRLALDILCYSGLLFQYSSNVRTRQSVGDRYLVNLASVFGEIDKKDRKTLVDVALRDMNIKRWIEFQAKSPSFTDCPAVDFSDDSLSRPDISAHLKRSIDVLEISDITKDKLKSAGFGTIQEVLAASVDDFKTLHYVGEKRADLVYNSVRASLYEYVT